MEQVGYQLIEIATDKVVQSWGGIWGQMPAIPNPISLPNGDQLCAPEVNVEYSGYMLKPWMIDPPAPPTPLTPAEKLAAAGLTVEDLKTLLGLN